MAFVVLGVSGGIGAYKAVEVARGLQQRGHEVVAVMTRSARRFVGAVTFEAITRHKVITDQFAPGANADIEHIAMASRLDLLLVAPATANVIGKLATGIADDFLSSLYLAVRAPVLLAPAMNTHMFEHPAVRQNLEVLRARGVRFVDPGDGYLACGWIGKGRLAEPPAVIEAAEALIRPSGSLLGRVMLITAGPTLEDLDPVRYLGNRSSGRMGFAIAAEAARRGATVTLVAGPTPLQPPPGVNLVPVRSAAAMHNAVLSRAAESDVLIMAAAVADYTPTAGSYPHKLSKDTETLSITLTRTPDILREVAEQRGNTSRPLIVGFAAETTDVVARARAKLRDKHLDLIVANDVSRPDAGFEVDSNAVTIISPAGDEPIPLQSKAQVAGIVLDRAEALLIERVGSAAMER